MVDAFARTCPYNRIARFTGKYISLIYKSLKLNLKASNLLLLRPISR